MKSDLFFSWLHRFDNFIGKQQGRKLALQIDKFSAHESPQTLLDLQHITVYFLPPDTTSKVQPCNAGIIAVRKVHYRTFQLEYALDLAESETKNIYQEDILSAMLAFKRIWNDPFCSVIENCWRHTGILSNEERFLLPVDLKAQCAHMFSMVSEFILLQNMIDSEELKNTVEEEECVQGIGDGVMLE